MIDAIREVGVYSIKKDKKDIIDVLTGNPNPTNKERIGIFLSILNEVKLVLNIKVYAQKNFQKLANSYLKTAPQNILSAGLS